jgi:hypothetical protein
VPKIRLEDERESSARPMEDAGRIRSLVVMKRRLLFTVLAVALLVLAVGGWLVQGIRLTPRLIAASVN